MAVSGEPAVGRFEDKSFSEVFDLDMAEVLSMPMGRSAGFFCFLRGLLWWRARVARLEVEGDFDEEMEEMARVVARARAQMRRRDDLVLEIEKIPSKKIEWMNAGDEKPAE